jgi:Flp pilus assembly protein TadD
LASAYEWLGDQQSARAARQKTIELLKRAVRLNSEDAVAQATLAALFAKEGRKEEAMEGIRVSLALSEKDPYVLEQVAEAYELIGEHKDAIRYLELAFSNGLTKQELNGDLEIQAVLSDRSFQMPDK